MKDNIQSLYNALIKNGYSAEDIGSADVFRTNMQDASLRDDLYNYVVARGDFNIGSKEAYDRRIGGVSTTEGAKNITLPTLDATAEVVPMEKENKDFVGGVVGSQEGNSKTLIEKPNVLPEEAKARLSANAEMINQSAKAQTEQFGKKLELLGSKEYKDALSTGKPVEKGMLMPQYVSPSGNVFDNQAQADWDAYRWKAQQESMTSAGQLRSAYKRLAEVDAKLEARSKQLIEEVKKNRSGIAGVLREVAMPGNPLAQVQDNDPWNSAEFMTDDEVQALRLQKRTLEKTIQNLENFHDTNANDGFWHNYFRNLGQGLWKEDAWDFGANAFRDANAMIKLDTKVKEAERKGEDTSKVLTEQEQDTMYEMYMNNALQNQYAVDSWGAQLGDISATSVSFMKDFLLTGGGFSSLSGKLASQVPTFIAKRALAKMSADAAGKSLGVQLAKDGLFTFVKNGGKGAIGALLAEQGIKSTAGILATRTLGIAIEDMLVRAPLMALTVQGQSTAAEIVKTNLGNVELDDDGQLRFAHDKSLGQAVWDVTADKVIENASEMWGAHLPSLTAATKTFGARNLTAMLLRSTRDGAETIFAKSNALLSKMGINGMFGEVAEEYYGQLLRTAADLESASDGKKNNFKNLGWHADIWCGIGLTVGLTGGVTMGGELALKAAGKGLDAADYYLAAHRLNRSSKHARSLFGEGVWDNMQFIIDATENANMGSLVAQLLTDQELTDKQKRAVLGYIGNAMVYRGHNLAERINKRDGRANPITEEQNDGYAEGYNTTSAQERGDVNNLLAIQENKVRELLGLAEDADVAEAVGNPLELIERLRAGYAGNAAVQTIIDYANAKAVVDGMVQRVRDDIDSRVAESDAMIDAATNTGGRVVQATTNRGEKVYVLSGNVVLNDNGEVVNATSDNSIIIYNPRTRKKEMVSPSALLEVNSDTDAAEMKNIAAWQIRNDMATAAAAEIDGEVALAMGDEYTLLDAEGNTHHAQIIGTAEDGSVVVMLDGQQTTMAAEDIKGQAKTYNMQRARDFDAAAHQAANAENVYNAMDEVMVRNDEGNVVAATITEYNADEDAYTLQLSEGTIDGAAAPKIGRAKMDARVESVNGEYIGEAIVPTDAAPAAAIPTDEQGNKAYESVEPSAAWADILAESEGDAEIAQSAVESMLEDKRKALAKAEKAKPAEGTTMAEKIAAQKAHKAAIEKAKADVAFWESVAQQKDAVATEEVAEQSEEVAPIVQEDADANAVAPTAQTEVETEATPAAPAKQKHFVDRIAEEWSARIGVPVQVVESVDEVVNDQAREAIENGVVVEGWYEPSTGRVCIYKPNFSTEQRVSEVIIHEAVAHKGLVGLLGQKAFDSLCDQVWAMMPQSVRDEYENYPGVKNIEDEVARHRAAADEYIAHLAEQTDLTDAEKTIWDKVIAALRTLLESAGINLKMSDADLGNLIKASYAKMAKEARESKNTNTSTENNQQKNSKFVTETNTEQNENIRPREERTVLQNDAFESSATNRGRTGEIIRNDNRVQSETQSDNRERIGGSTRGRKEVSAAGSMEANVTRPVEEIQGNEPTQSNGANNGLDASRLSADRQRRINDFLAKNALQRVEDLYGVIHTIYDVLPNGVAVYHDSNGNPSLFFRYEEENGGFAYMGVFRTADGKWTSNASNDTGDKSLMKDIISSVMERLPKGVKFYEETSISVDGLRLFSQQQRFGFTRSGEHFECALNDGNQANGFEKDILSPNLTEDELEAELDLYRDNLEETMASLGMTREDIFLEKVYDTDNGSFEGYAIKLRLPVLVKQAESNKSKFSVAQQKETEAAIAAMENSELGQALMPTEEAIEVANEVDDEVRFAIAIAEDIEKKSTDYHRAYHEQGKVGRLGIADGSNAIPADILGRANEAIRNMVDVVAPHLNEELFGARVLPEEVYGKGTSTIFSNGSYGRTMENLLICLRTLSYNEFTDDVKEKLGRPITAMESFLASQMLYDIAVDPQCLYCYVSLDRKAYDEFLLRYLEQRDAVVEKFKSLKDKSDTSALYEEYLDGRKDTKEMKARFNQWISIAKNGGRLMTAEDLTTASKRRALIQENRELAKQIKDAEKYAQSASWAKKMEDYRAYTGELLRMPIGTINMLNSEYGLRFYSFSEFNPAFIVENMQMVRDAALRGLKGLAYTKDIDFVKIFAPTGININVSVFGRRDSNGEMQPDIRQGADWNAAKELREEYDNVGVVFVATNDLDVEWALGQDFVDVVIPFHIVRTGTEISNFYGWENYSSQQSDKDAGGRKKDVMPTEHHNNKETYLSIIEERGLTPRFEKWKDHPNYMKLVNETRQSVDNTTQIQPVFNLDAAKESWGRFYEKGGYFGGWYNVDQAGYEEAVEQVVEDIKAGKTAKDVEYGRQDMPINEAAVFNPKLRRGGHGNTPRFSVAETEAKLAAAEKKVANAKGVAELADAIAERERIKNETVRFSRGGAPRSSLREEYDRRTRRPTRDNDVSWYSNVGNRLVEAYQDSMHTLKVLQDLVAEETGTPIESFENAYWAENRMSSMNKTQQEAYERDFMKPMHDALMRLQKEGASYQEIVDYLFAKHGLERNQVFAQREGKVRDYSGLSALTGSSSHYTDIAQQMVDDFEAKYETDELWEKINAATKQSLKTEYDAGLMSKETYDYVSTMFEYYIPLRGWSENAASNEYDYIGSGKPKMTSKPKKATGRRSLADDPIATIGHMGGNSIIRANRNKMKQHFLNFALNHETDLLTVTKQWYVFNPITNKWERNTPDIPIDATGDEVADIIRQHEADMKALGAQAKLKKGKEMTGMHITTGELKEHEVRIFQGGTEYVVYINGNPRAAQALNGTLNPDSGNPSFFKRAARYLKDFMSQAFTSWNPAFVIDNFRRDQAWSLAAVATKENAQYLAQFELNNAEVFVTAQMPRLLHAWKKGELDLNDPIQRYFNEFMMNGGETGFTQLHTVNQYKKDIQRMVRKSKGGVLNAMDSMNIFRKSAEGFELWNRMTEDHTRFVTYMTSRQMGRDVARSVWDAKEITVNFNKKGSGEMGAKYMNFAYVFFNASIQGMANFGKVIKNNPKKATAMLGSFCAMGALLPMLNELMLEMMGDDEDKQAYADLPEWVRENNLVFYIPFTKRGFITWPLPHELRPAYKIGMNAYAYFKGEKTGEEALWDVAKGAADMLPLKFDGNDGNLLVNLAPTVLQPFMQVQANVNYFGQNVYREPMFGKKGTPAHMLAYKGTAPLLVKTSAWLNEATGGNDVDKGTISINPDIAEHLLESYLGGTYKFYNQVLKTALMPFNEDLQEVRNVPILNKFYVSSGDERNYNRSSTEVYYAAVEEAENTQRRLREYSYRHGIDQYADLLFELQGSPEMQRMGVANTYKSAISEINRAININKAQENKQEVDTLEAQKRVLIQQAAEQLRELEE